MPVYYNSKKIIPAPFVSIQKEYQSAGQDVIGKTFRITLTGTLITHMGSPDSEREFWDQADYPPDEVILHDSRMGALLRKQEGLRSLFSDQYQLLEIQPLDGSDSMRCYPQVLDMNFSEGIWVDRIDYTITLQTNEIYPIQEDDFDEYIQDATETWQIETDETPEGLNLPRTYRVTHTVSAVGKKVYDGNGLVSEPYVQARNYVLARLGFDQTIALASGVNNLPSYYTGYNHIRSQEIDKVNGGFSVTENWLVASGTALENFTIELSTDINNAYPTVSIQGDITGLEQRDSNLSLVTSKYQNAVTKFNEASGLAYLRAKEYSGLNTLNIFPTQSTVGRNPITGTINYSYQYDTRPSNIIPSAKSEIITINEGLVGQAFASVFILGRRKGPILQDLNTKPARTRQVSIELIMPPATFAGTTMTDLQNAFFSQNPRLSSSTSGVFQSIIDAVDPLNNGFVSVKTEQPQESWNPKNGQYSYNQNWIFEHL
jgi:hypothetical protein